MKIPTVLFAITCLTSSLLFAAEPVAANPETAEKSVGKNIASPVISAGNELAVPESCGRELLHGVLPSMALRGKGVPYTILAPAGVKTGSSLPMLVYLRNLPMARLGTVPDSELIQGFLSQGMLVAVVDYGKQDLGQDGGLIHDEFAWLYSSFGAMRHTAHLERSASQGRDPVRLSYEGAKLRIKVRSGLELTVDPDWVYVLPEGYTLVRNVTVMDLPYPPPRNRVRIDLMLPAKPKQAVPLILELSARDTQAGDREMTPLSFNSPYPMSYAYSGYAVAIMGFVFEEPLPGETLAFGRDFAEHRALRLLRARKGEWGLSGKIGIMGMSKASTRVLLAAAKRPDQASRIDATMAARYPYSALYRGFVPEWMARDFPEDLGKGIFPFPASERFRGIPEERDLGPYAKENDCPDAVYCGAVGIPSDLPYVVPYLTQALPPLILCTGAEDGWVGWRPGQICARLLRDALKDAGATNLLYVEQQGLGHAYNHLRFDEFKAWFDALLKPTPPPSSSKTQSQSPKK